MPLSRFVVGLLLAAFAQGVPGPTRGDSMNGLVVGQVVDGESGRPVSGAVVVLTGPSAARGAAHPRILTGNDGRFVYCGLRQGSYRIFATRQGFAPGAYGRSRPGGTASPLQLADGERTADVLVRMWKTGAISGAVVDESGEHLIGISVQAYRRTIVSGKRAFVASGTGTTDDRGIYRIADQMPGDYIVGASVQHDAVPLSSDGPMSRAVLPGSSSLIPIRDAGYVVGNGTPTPPPGSDGRFTIYPPTFHPDAHAAEAALVVNLRPGMEYLGADVQLRPVGALSVSGSVVGPEGPVTMTPLQLVAAESVAVGVGGLTTTTDRGGRFTFPVVPQGHYTLRLVRGAASGPRGRTPAAALLWSETPLSVGLTDIENLMVEAQPGLVIGGRVEFETDGSAQAPRPSAVTVTIEAADPHSTLTGSTGIQARVYAYGEFRSTPLPGGRYYVRIANSPSGWMFKSATAGGQDVADTPLTVTSSTLDVIVTFTNRWSGLRGIVQNREGPDASAAVLVFPVDESTWSSSGANARRVRLVRPNRTGEYSLNLPAGEYYVVAVPDGQAGDWQDPDFLTLASRAAERVRIRDGERPSRDLRTRELR